MKIIFLVEEESMKQVLEVILPQILSKRTQFKIIAHQGRGDLIRSIPLKLNSWRGDDVCFVIVHDQDNKDCFKLKSELVSKCRPYNRTVLIRIVCRELESWYFGDLNAVFKAYCKDLKDRDIKRLSSICARREPDKIVDPKQQLKRHIPKHQQISGAKRIAAHMNVSSNKSHSFNVFIDGVLRLERDCR